MRLTLKLMNGEILDQSVDTGVIVIGRSSKCTIHVPHEGMSRQHCQIEVVNGELFVTDLNSTNGVFIDGNRIPPNERIPYNTYLQLAFGAVMSVQIDLEEEAPALVQQRPSGKVQAVKEEITQQTIVKPRLQTIHKKKKDNKLAFWLTNVMVAGIILFFVFWFMDGKEENPEYYESADEIPSTDPNEKT